jgi:hypothetical protein
VVSPSRAALAALGCAFALACNPVLDDQISALGGEKQGVPRGPNHRPGQPCTLCHDGALSDPPAFSVAGTVFQDANGTAPLSGIEVQMVDVTGAKHSELTNAAGNFYVSPKTYQPIYPMKVTLLQGQTSVTMQSHVGWAGGCAICHKDPAGPDSPGHVYFNVPPGGTP